MPEATQAKIRRMQVALEQIANCGQSKEPDHWKFRCWAREIAQAALTPDKRREE